MAKFIDLTGQKFGRLTVIEEAGRDKRGVVLWKCLCNCGNIRIIPRNNLQTGNTSSCGCLQIESRITHGMAKTPTYNSWQHMIDRCNNPKNDAYSHYGERGISVCEEWANSFDGFLKDMGKRPKGLTIERINNDLGYSKENCYWASQTAQMRNQRIQKRNKTGVRGVWWDKRRQNYSVKISINKKVLSLGCFVKLSEAKAARQRAEQKYWEGGS